MDYENDIDALSRHILETSGVVDVNSSDCKKISEKIFKKTRHIISETTLKRLFGFAKRDTNFSRFTLDTLASYAGFTNWNEFKRTSHSDAGTTDFSWDKLKQRALSVTSYSLHTIKNGAGIPFSKTIERQFINQDYQRFINSDKLFTVMAAQSGHGKSILIARLTDYFFTGENALYPDDIPIVINGAVINNLVLQGADVEHWIKHEIGLAFDSGFGQYLKNNPQHSKGRIVLFFDGLNLEELGIHYFNRVIDLLLYYNSPWFKVVLSMGLPSWTYFKQVIRGSSHLENCWYKGLFFDSAESSNIPYFTKNEVASVLENLYETPIDKENVDLETYKLLKYPYWFHVFSQFLKHNKNISPKEHLIYYELIFKFVNQKLFNTLRSTEKTHLLLQIISDSDFNKKANYIEKRYVLAMLSHYNLEYKELLQSAILTEKIDLINGEATEIVRLHYPELLPFLLCRRALLDSNFKVNQAFFNKTLQLYGNDQDLLTKILKWIVRYCVINDMPQQLIQILDMPFTRNIKNSLMEFAYEVINFELDKYDSDFAKRGVTMPLINFLVNGKILSKQFVTTIKNIQNLATEAEEISLFIDLLLCIIAIANYQQDELEKVLGRLEKMHKRIKRELPIDVYEMALGVYKQMLDYEATEQIKAETNRVILDFCDKTKAVPEHKHKDIFTLKELLTYRIAANILFIRRDYDVCYELITCIQYKHPNIMLYRNSNFVHLIKISMGSTCLKTENLRMAKKIHSHLEDVMNSSNTYFAEYIAVIWFAFKAEYAVFFKDYKSGLILVNKALDIASKNDLTIPALGLTILKLEITRNSFEQEDFADTFRDLTKLLKTGGLNIDIISKFASTNVKAIIDTYRN